MYDEILSGGWLNPQLKPLTKSFVELGRQYDPTFSGNTIVDEIQKALATGAVSMPGFGDATPIRLENLDAQMTEVLLTMAHFKMFNLLPRVTSIQPRFEWIRHTGYGTARRAPGFAEGGAPTSGNSSWLRGEALNKYMGVKRGLTHQALITGQLGGMFTDPVMSENRDGTRQLLEMIERWFVWGDKDIKDKNGVEVNYDGVYQQLLDTGPSSIIDKKGQPLEFSDLNEYGVRFVDTGKLLDFSMLRSFASPFVLQDLSDLKLQAERAQLSEQAARGYTTGTPLRGHMTQFGVIPFEPSILLEAVPTSSMLTSAESGVVIAKPATTTAVAASEATSLMEAGTYYYGASAMADEGETDGRMSTATAVVVGEKVTVTIARVTGATGYRVYRGLLSDGSDAKWIATIPQPGSGDAVYVDLNQIRPGSGIMLIMNAMEEDNAIAQMSPLIKFPQPVEGTTIPFLLILYHVLVVKAWERVIFVKNIGKRT